MFGDTINNTLKQKLDKNVIRQRSEAGVTLDYLEGWYVINQLNEIFGFGNWNTEIIELCEIGKAMSDKGMIEVGYRARVKISIIGRATITREDVGFGNGISKREFKAHELAGKEAVTDALKRACRTLGDVFGNTLYDKEKKGVADFDKEAKTKIVEIIKEIAPKENLKSISTYIVNNGLDISKDPRGALEQEAKLREIIQDFLENKPKSAFDGDKQ